MLVRSSLLYTDIIERTDEEYTKLTKLLDNFPAKEKATEEGEEPELIPQSMLFTEDGREFFYTGLISFLVECGMTIEVEKDSGSVPTGWMAGVEADEDILTDRTLRDYQMTAIRKGLYSHRGVFQAPTGSGKTEMMAALLQHHIKAGLIKTAMIVVPTGHLMEQTADKLRQFGISNVGELGYGKKKISRICVAVADSVSRALEDVDHPLRSVDALVYDEAHHARSQRWITIAQECKAKYRWAFTATVYEDPTKISYEDLQLFGLFGGVLCEINARDLMQRGFLARPLVTFIQPSYSKLPPKFKAFGFVHKIGIIQNKARNSVICSLAASIYRGAYKSLIFVTRKDHGHKLAEALAKLYGTPSIFVQGAKLVDEYTASGVHKLHKWNISEIAEYVNSREKAVVLTTQVLDEGIDIPIINVLIMAGGLKKYRRSVQRIGRGMRPKGDDNRVFVFDFYDTAHFYLTNQSVYRMNTYRWEGFDFSDSVMETESEMRINLEIDRNLFYSRRVRGKKK